MCSIICEIGEYRLFAVVACIVRKKMRFSAFFLSFKNMSKLNKYFIQTFNYLNLLQKS